jgi:hypothetical protein
MRYYKGISLRHLFLSVSFDNLFVCLLVCFEAHEQFFRYLATVTITGDRAANLDLCLALTAFSSEGSFTNHNYCDTGPPFLRSYPKGPWFSLLNAVILASGARTHDLPDAKREHYRNWYWNYTRYLTLNDEKMYSTSEYQSFERSGDTSMPCKCVYYRSPLRYIIDKIMHHIMQSLPSFFENCNKTLLIELIHTMKNVTLKCDVAIG